MVVGGGGVLDGGDDTWMDSGESGEEDDDEQEVVEEDVMKKGRKKGEKKEKGEVRGVPQVEKCGKWEKELVEKLRENLMRWGAMRWRLGFLQMKKDRFVGVLFFDVLAVF